MHAKIICKMWRQIFEMNAKRQINDRQDSWTARNGRGKRRKLAEYAKMREEISCLAVFIAQISEIKTEVNLSSKIVECGEQSIGDYIVRVYQI